MTARPPGPVFGIARRERIMEALRRTGAVTVRDLAVELGVTEITIRRDITALADRGLVTRVHGGATLRSALDTSIARNPDAAGPALYRIGMVVPSLSYYWPQIVNGTRAAATAARVQLVLRGASYDPADQRRQIAALLESGVHGLLVAPEVSGSAGLAILTWLDALSVPVVLVERRAPHSAALRRLEWVSTDHDFGAKMAVHHLYEQGHRRIGLALARDSPTAPQLRRGWEQALLQLGLDTDVVTATLLDIEEATEREARFGEIVSTCRDTGTTALIVHADPQAILFGNYCADHGIDIPRDLAIVAYDDEVAENGTPPISALRPAKEYVGRLALETMMTRLREGSSRPIQRTVVLPELEVRASSIAQRTG
ncbi:substrate-binding domain-containing protein [Pseudonocardia sp. TRM90224]|uniref:substrate-binding domain-containing protein n=1 Tax=Pseudonocardia sp. TRM90224 TaxID=2812678 RepID=UPI001E63F79B|nr:substrate-binding domain-containing protein [Pseudonocardia sp. TRM90224]